MAFSNTPYIPPATADKLAATHPKGTRHQAMKDMAVPLIGNGWASNAVFGMLRPKFGEDVTDVEIRGVIEWAESVNPSPSGLGGPPASPKLQNHSRPPTETKQPPIERAAWWLRGATMARDKFVQKSKLVIPDEPTAALVLALEMLWAGSENLNIVCQFIQTPGEDKARPCGPGRILTRDKWLEYVADKGVPSSNAGAWLRPNPVSTQGTGTGGATTDSDVVAWRYLLLESDVLPLETQLALFAAFKLPIAAVVMSGGLSAHAWVRLEAVSEAAFEQTARRLLSMLAPFGIDQANKNPSRLSRLPGATRRIGAVESGIQSLLWLNPSCPAMDQKTLSEFESSLLVQSIDEKPFHRLVSEAITRYEFMHANQGKLGVPTGFSSFDRVSGGLKPNGYTLIAAETGVGKTTLAVNMINAALKAGIGVCLFSLEMTREDVVDMMFSIRGMVDRNKFNTGAFDDRDFAKMVAVSGDLSKLPLWVDDTPESSPDMIEKITLQLRAENKIGLVVIDYAQLVPLGTPVSNREQEVAQVALAMRVLSKKSNIPFVLLSQLNDEGKVRESRKLAHEAATVMILSRDSDDNDDPNMTLKIAKGRKIPSKPIKLYLKAEYCLITERSPVEAADIPPTKQPHND